MDREMDREMYKKILFQGMLVELLKYAKNGYETSFLWKCSRLFGALDYAYCSGDISGEADRRIRRLVSAIKRKYCIQQPIT